MDIAYSRIRDEEALRLKALQERQGADLSALSLRVFPNTTTPRVDRSKLMCTHCRKSGHDVDTCFLKHGYPDSEWGAKQKQRLASRLQSKPAGGAVPTLLTAGSPTYLVGGIRECYHGWHLPLTQRGAPVLTPS